MSGRIVIVAWLMSIGALHAAAQVPPHSCAEYARGFKSKIEEDYAGYRLEVVGKRQRAYDSVTTALDRRAARTATDDCYPVLKSFIDWFHDPHLFVFQSTRGDSANAERRRQHVRMRPISEPAFRADLRARRDADPIEGIWTDGTLRVAVERTSRDRFAAVVLTPDTSIWMAGAVRADIVRRRDATYDVQLLGRDYSLRQLDGVIHKRTLLRISPEMWAKEYPLDPNDVGLVDVGDPRRPTLQVREGTVVVSIPSHSPAYAPVLDSLVRRNAAPLHSSPRLIVDLRGNEGGSSWMTDVFLPYILTDSLLPPRYPDRAPAMLLSSPDQISYARSAFGSDTSSFVRSLLERMRAHPGQFVTFEPPGAARPEPKADSIVYGPRRVGVLVDRGTVSASEVLVLRALRSTRATVFGEPTEGALDYQSTAIVRVVPSPARWFLGYPTIARDTLLPLDGMRGRGIAPQVRVDWANLADPIGWVDLQLRSRSTTTSLQLDDRSGRILHP
jgi:hypothetical protein